MQYDAALAIAGAIRSSSREKLYQEQGLESLRKWDWCRKLHYLFKIIKGESADYLFKIRPSVRRAYSTRNTNNFCYLNTRHNFLSFSKEIIQI